MAQLNQLKMPLHKLLAESALKLKDVGIASPLADDLVKHTISVTYLHREREDRQKHERSVARTPAIYAAVGGLIGALLARWLSRLSGGSTS
jgi:hypothetical protein